MEMANCRSELVGLVWVGKSVTPIANSNSLPTTITTMTVQTPQNQLYSEADIQKAISAIKITNTARYAKLLSRSTFLTLLYKVACPDVNRVLQLMKQSKSFQPPKKRHYPDGLRV